MSESEVIAEWTEVSIPGRFPEQGVEKISLKIHRGERIAFIGTQFAGRSQVIRILGGTRPYFEGKFLFYGEEIPNFFQSPKWDDPYPTKLRRKVGATYEKDGLLSNVSVREGLEMLFRFKYGDHNKGLIEGASRVVREVSAQLGLSEELLDSRPGQLNSAQSRLASLARVFLAKPSVVVLENPTDTLGLVETEKVYFAMETMLEDPDRVLLLSTGDWGLAHHFCPRWIYIENGKAIFDGPADEFLKGGYPIIREMKRAYTKHSEHQAELWRRAL